MQDKCIQCHRYDNIYSHFILQHSFSFSLGSEKAVKVFDICLDTEWSEDQQTEATQLK